MVLVAGEKLGPYEIVAPIGKGGMGEVYRAHDTRLKRDVAIKVSAERFTERFEHEARAIAALNHPNICTLHDVGPNYLVMELVDGPTLADRIKEGPIPLEESLNIARQVAAALDAAHDKGIVHRDLKPGNIKIRPDGTVKVLDFGLAKMGGTPSVPGNESPTLTVGQNEAGLILGTASYMSPEQAKGKVVDHRADIYAFGAVLYEMLTDKRLHPGESTAEILASVIKQEPLWDKVPTQVQKLLRRCLEKDPQKRLRHIGDVMALLDDAPVASPPTKPAEEQNASWWARQLPWWIASVGISSAALLAFVHFRETPLVFEPVRFEIQPPPQNRFGIAFALSPDGRKLAFAANGPDGRSFLWVRSLDSIQAKLLPGTEGATTLPFWSPDSRFLAYGATGKLKKVEATGGPPQVLCDAPALVIGGSWGLDGTILFSGNNSGILKISSAGGIASPVTALAPGEPFHAYPFFLPDGRHFLYERRSQGAEIYVGSLDAKPEQQRSSRLVSSGFATYAPSSDHAHGYLLFMRERTLMAQAFDAHRLRLSGEPVPIADPVGLYAARALFSASNTGTLAYRSDVASVNRLTWFDRQGKLLSYATDAGFYNELSLSPDASRIAGRRMDSQTSNNDIWISDLRRGGSTRFTFDPATDSNPVWSPDGRIIVFASNRTGAYNLYQKDASGAGAETLLIKSSLNQYPQDWSRDGRFLIYSQLSPQTGYDLWILPMTGDRKPVPFLGSQFNEDQGQFSPTDAG